MPRRDAYEAQHARNRVKYEKQIKAIFEEVCRESGLSVTQLQNLIKSAGENAEIAKIPAVRKVLDKLHSRLAKELKTTVVDGIKAEWKLANSKYDALIGTMVAGDLMEQMDRERREKMMAQNLAARDAFIARKECGLDLSQRVWHYSGQMRDAIEAGLEAGIWEGRSAAEIARDLKQYLQYPDKLFRRVRVKAEEEGKEDKFRLSKAAAAFHPGQGVYRSSYKNALRLALNETNIAYRKADTARRIGLDFVVGIEVHLSNNHNCKGVPEGEFFDICDILQGKYPSDFDFSGWHPNCYSDDSEVLTNRGWQLFRDVVPNDWILSLNPDTRQMEWTTISAMQSYPYTGPMVHFFNRSLDCLVTPDHRMVYLDKTSGAIKYLPASDYRKGNGAFYRGCEYGREDINSITIGERTYDFDAFCRFMGFWLADGACFNVGGITIAQSDGQPAKPKIIEAVRALGYEPTVYPGSVRFYRNELVRYLRRFGHCNEKYIPDVIKQSSPRQIRLFLDAFLQCDGSIRPPKDFIGNRGAYFHSDFPDRTYFTTSRRMAGDLCELILKVGHRPSVRESRPGTATKKDGTVIKSNYPCFRIAELKATMATVFDKETIDYDGMVYDLTLVKNHIMYIKRNGRCFWGSNCRCYTTTILQTEEEFFRDSDGIYRGSVNEVKDVPPQFKRWLEENKGRIEQSEKRGKLPYFLRDNRKFWQNDDGSVMLPDPPQGHEKTPDELRREKFLAIAKKRHAARTPEQKKAIMDAWDADRGYLLRAGKDSPHWLMKASGMNEDDIIKVLSDINDNLPDDKKWFVNGFNGLIGIKNYKYNGSTNRTAGTIKLNEPIMESVKDAFKKIANKESHHITQSEAEAMGTFWHEITHNRTHAKVVSLGAVASDYKEIANEFVARRSLPEFYKALGAGKLPQPHVMLSCPNTEYNDWVMRYQAVIKKYNLNQTDVEKVVKYGLFNGEYNKLKGVLADGLIAGGLKDKNGVIVKKSVALRVIEFCRTGK